MNLNSVGTVPAALAAAPSGDAVAIAVLKKTLDIQKQSALQLIAALPQPATVPTATLGNNVNNYA